MVLSYLGYNVIATDKASVIPLLQRNVDQFKGSSGSILVSKFDWGDSYNKDNDSLLLIEGKSPDVIVCSDCLYSAASVEPLLETLVKVKILYCCDAGKPDLY